MLLTIFFSFIYLFYIYIYISFFIFYFFFFLSFTRARVCDTGYRFRFELLREPPGVHVHPVALLPCARSDFGPALRAAHRYVVTGLHPSRASSGLPAPARRRRIGSIGLHDRAARYASSATHRAVQTRQDVLLLQRFCSNTPFLLPCSKKMAPGCQTCYRLCSLIIW